MSRAAKVVAVLAFALTEIAALFGTWIVASIQCCQAGAASPPAPQDWATVVVFAVIMIVPSALVGAGAAVATEGALMLTRVARNAAAKSVLRKNDR